MFFRRKNKFTHKKDNEFYSWNNFNKSGFIVEIKIAGKTIGKIKGYMKDYDPRTGYGLYDARYETSQEEDIDIRLNCKDKVIEKDIVHPSITADMFEIEHKRSEGILLLLSNIIDRYEKIQKRH